MGKKKNIGGVVPLTPTDKELAQWNILFDSYLWMEPQKVKDGKEPGRVCYCTRCRKTYRVDEWARVSTAEERDILTAKQGYHIKCAKCGVVCEALVAEAVKKGKREASEAYEKAIADANGNVERLMNKLAAAQEDTANAEKVKAKAIERRDELIARFDEEKEKHEAEVCELREKADRLAAELEAAKSEPVQESIVYVEKEAEQADKPTEDGKAAKLEEELKAVQEKLAEAEQRAAAVEHKADMRVQAVNFALREIAGKVADIGGAIDELEQGGEGELAGKLKASAAKAIKTMLEGATWYGNV